MAAGAPPLTPPELGVIASKPAHSQKIIDAEKKLIYFLKDKGYPFAKIEDREVVVNRAQKYVSVKLLVDKGPYLHFGQSRIQGLQKVKELFLLRKIEWKPDEVFSISKLEKTQKDLEESGLFSSVAIATENYLDGNTIPTVITVTERKHRSIGTGASYSTYKGIGGLVEWEHRNIRNLGEKVSVTANITERSKLGNVTYQKPDFRRKGQDLLWIVEGEEESTKSYRKRDYNFSGIINRKIDDRLNFSYGGKLEQQKTTNSDNDRYDTLFSIPLRLNWINTPV